MLIDSREDAVMLRQVLEPIWAEYYEANGDRTTAPSTNMCCRTASMIREIDSRWRIVHGVVGVHAHAWCERGDGVVLDITGDQFGGAPVLWGDLPDDYIEDDYPDDVDGCGRGQFFRFEALR